MNTGTHKLILAICDALSMDIVPDGQLLRGERKAKVVLFEGYSPTVLMKITNSFVCRRVAVACVQVWGNLKVMIVAEKSLNRLSVFVYDGSLAPVPNPIDTYEVWSRSATYGWLEGHCRAIYSRSLYETSWSKLPSGAIRLMEYNVNRLTEMTAKQCHDQMWSV